MNTLSYIHLPNQTTITTTHSSGAAITEVMHTLSGRPVFFGKKLYSRPAQLVFNADLAWLDQAQHDALISLADGNFSPVQVSINGKNHTAIFNHSAADSAVSLTPIMPFCDRYYGVINLIILE